MSVLAEIRELEEAVARLVGSVALPGASDARLAEAATEAVLALLDEAGLSLADLDGPEARAQIAEALADVFPDWADDLRQQVADRVADLVDLVEAFYDERGVETAGLRQAARQAALARQLTDALESGFGTIQKQLADVTVEKIREQLLAGQIDRVALASAIEEATGVSARFARTQAQAAVGGLNQTYREQVAQRAGLDHYHYYGNVQDNTRPFCRIHVGYVFPRARIEQMRNGMLEPVLVFKGGFNCRHAWLPVDPAWDPELAGKVVDVEPTEVATTLSGNRKIVVVAPPGRIERLRTQIPLQTRGFHRFVDAESNESGFVAVHEDWWAARMRARKGSKVRSAYDRWLEDSVRQAEEGQQLTLFPLPEVAEGAAPLTADEIDALRRYTHTEYRDLNDSLRYGVRLDDEQEAFSRHLTSGLAKLPAHEGTVFRGVPLPDPEWAGDNLVSQLEQYAGGDYPLVFPEYVSTSLREDTAQSFSLGDEIRVILTIQSRRGRFIREHSSVSYEDEVLFDRDSAFYVTDFRREGDLAFATLEEI